MSESLQLEDAQLNLYGYKGRKYVRAHNTWRIGAECFYTHVPDDFSFAAVTKCRVLYNYEDWQGYRLSWKGKNGEKRDPIQVDFREIIPFGDPKLYSVVTSIIELAELFGIEHELDQYYSAEKVQELMNAVQEKVEEQNRLLTLLKGKDIHALLRELDATKLKLVAAEEYKVKNAKLEAELISSHAANTESEQKLSQCGAVIHKLQSEREQYKRQVITTLQEAVSKL